MNAVLLLSFALAGNPGEIERGNPRPFAPKYEVGVSIYPVVTTGVERRLPAFKMSAAPGLMQDVQDLVFLGEKRPIKARLRLKQDGGSLIGPWEKQVRKMYDYFDRDGSGSINANELEYVITARGIQGLMNSGYNTLRTAADPLLMKDVDRDRDGQMSFDEYAVYLNSATSTLVRVMPNANRDIYGEMMTQELFTLLDENKNGKLTKAEVSRIESLMKRDMDEDECLSALELIPGLFNRPYVQPVAVRPGQPQPVVNTGPLTIVPAGQIPTTMIQQMITQYDKDKDQVLTREEIGFDAETFEKLDDTKDGKLTAAELENWRKQRADLEIELSLTDKLETSGAKILSQSPGVNLKLEPTTQGRVFLRLSPTQHLEFVITTGPAQNFDLVNRNGIAQQFTLVDTQNRGYILEKDIAAGPQFQFIRILFDGADRNYDGKLTKVEFDAYFAMQAGFSNLSLALQHSTEMPSLFSALDADRDGRLSVREMRKAWERLQALQPSATDEITKEVLQPMGTVRFGRAMQLIYAPQAQGNFAMFNQQNRAPTEGPIWFRKMDRNGDGEISRSEFLGMTTDFDRIDTDHDGLISRAEAEAVKK